MIHVSVGVYRLESKSLSNCNCIVMLVSETCLCDIYIVFTGGVRVYCRSE